MKRKIIEALCNWVIEIADRRRMATPEEIAVLPKIAKICISYSLDLHSPTKNE